MIRVNVSELNSFSVDVGKMSSEIEEDVKKVVKNSAFNIQKEAMSNLTKNKSVDTGHLRRGITTDIR